MHRTITQSRYRTFDPDEATLFFLPITPTRKMHLSVDAHGWAGAALEANLYLESAIERIRAQYPYFDRRGGSDHFVAITADHGVRPARRGAALTRQRCSTIQHLAANVTQQLMFVQHHGALHQESYDPLPCFQPHRDILLPAYVPEADMAAVPVVDPARPNTALLAFSSLATTALTPFHGVRVRKALAALWERTIDEGTQLEGAVWQLGNITQTAEEMGRSLTCVTPPGIVRAVLC